MAYLKILYQYLSEETKESHKKKWGWERDWQLTTYETGSSI